MHSYCLLQPYLFGDVRYVAVVRIMVLRVVIVMDSVTRVRVRLRQYYSSRPMTMSSAFRLSITEWSRAFSLAMADINAGS